VAALDEALAVLRGSAPEYGGGLSNHGPMAAEALCTLGRGPDAVRWAERYRRRLGAAPAGRERIPPSGFREALGDVDRFGDWVAFFDRELSEAPWQQVLRRWVPELAPGFAGAATHGILRVAHAARGLSGERTNLRLREMVEALAYWACRHQSLPERKGTRSGRLPSQALPRVERLPQASRRRGGLITDGLGRLGAFPPFAGVADMADPGADPAGFLSDLTRTFARVYLGSARDTGMVITFIHSVTGTAAARLLLPYLDPSGVARLLRYAWQTAAGLWVVFGTGIAAEPIEADDVGAGDLVDCAVVSGDEHAIKLTEACLREHAFAPCSAYLAAADHAVGALSVV